MRLVHGRLQIKAALSRKPPFMGTAAVFESYLLSSVSIFVGMVALVLAALTILPVFVVSGIRIYGPLMWVGIPLASYALFALLQGIWQLHRTLNPKMLKSMNAGPEPTFAASVTAALPPAMVNAYVTEGTTELLIPTGDHRVSEPIRRKEADTAEIDTDRLM